MRSVVFCIFCSFVMIVVIAIGDHIVESYTSIGLGTHLYLESDVSLCLPIRSERGTDIACWYSFDALATVLSMSIFEFSI